MRAVSRRMGIALVSAAFVALPACSGDDGTAGSTIGSAATAPGSTVAGGDTTPSGTTAPQPLTLPQAQVLASMRAANYRIGQATFQTAVTDRGTVVSLRGVVDWQRHVGSAVYTTVAGRTDPSADGLMQWNFEKVSAHPGGAVDGPPPPPEADGAWVQRAIDPTQSPIDTLFVLLLSIASQQPDNPQLLQQSDAAYLGTEIVAGRTASVFAGPTSDAAVDPASPSTSAAGGSAGSGLTYWVADDGALVRLRANLGGAPVTVEFSAAPAAPTAFLPDLLPQS